MEPPQNILDEPSGLAAFNICAQSWQTPSTTESASLQLLGNGEKEAIYSIIHALHEFAYKAPALNHTLNIIAQGFAQLPKTTRLNSLV